MSPNHAAPLQTEQGWVGPPPGWAHVHQPKKGVCHPLSVKHRETKQSQAIRGIGKYRSPPGQHGQEVMLLS